MRTAELLVLVATVISCSDPERARSRTHPEPIARVVALSGDVRVRHAGASHWIPVRSESVINPDDMIQTLGSGSVVLRVVATGGELAMSPGTTMRFDASPHPHAVNGKIVAKIADPLRPAKLEVVTPPGVVVLSSTPIGGGAEAQIEVDDDKAAVELRSGHGVLRRTSSETVLERRRMAFDRDGLVQPITPTMATIAVLEPADRAALRVRQRVVLDWTPVAGADRYEVRLVAGPLERDTEVAKPPLLLPISSGEYEWTVRAFASAQIVAASEPRTFRVVVDNHPPGLTLSAPAEGATVEGPRLRIAGITEPGAVIEVAKIQVVVDASGAFSVFVPIQRGLSNFVISTRDDLGNQRRISRSVVWE